MPQLYPKMYLTTSFLARYTRNMTLTNQFVEARKFGDFYTFAKTIEASEVKITRRKVAKMLQASEEYRSLSKPDKAKYFNALVFVSLGRFKL